jgi:signal transduction histidine kinase
VLILNVIQGPDKGRRFELPDNEPQLIGRSSEALPLTDTTISRRHAELTPDEGQWLINDLSSSNGTYVNGRRIVEQTLLKPGDQIRTGATIFVYGRPSEAQTSAKAVRVLGEDRLDFAVEKTVSSGEESIIMAVPEPAQAAARHLKILYDVMALIGSEIERQPLLTRVMDAIFEHFKADRGFILMRDAAGRPEPVVVRHRRQPRTEDEQRISVSRTIVQHVMSHSQGVLSSNAMTDTRFAGGDSVKAYGIRSAICVPIIHREKMYGVIYIDSKMANYTFTEDQLRLLTAIGMQTGLALANADLYQQQLQRARLAAVGETVASLSHSIRNILQAMRGGAEVIELGLRKKDLTVVTSGWDVLSRNLDRIFDMTMNMLTFSKHRKPEFSMVILPALLAEIATLFRPQCERRGVELRTELDETMPPIPADSSGVHQAVMNLLTNALDAVDLHTGVITIRCRYDEATHEATIDIADNGPGMDADTRAQIFTPFYSTKGLRGTGLGLAVTKKVIEEHGGKISVQTEPGRGTTFTLHLSTETRADPSATHA